MRAVQKRKAEKFVDILSQAQEEIKKEVLAGKLQEAQELAEDCQNCAIALGTLIEKSEGEGFITVRLLEEYCELLYQMHRTVEEKEFQAVEWNTVKMREKLDEIGRSVKRDIKTRREVVLLPYKASMWDSLESIWIAAREDPECDVYVIPIPYYDKKPDGSFHEMHYEGDLFPEYVPVTRYDAYDFEANCPGAIYIHNPYDEYNFVTSVHPFFYAKNLKKYTSLLVYVPYYATSGIMAEAQSLLPAYLYSDYIVVQSEKMVKYFDPAVSKEKFLAMGSPKFDRIIRMNADKPGIPEDWQEIAQGKKVYFYNTSINEMLADTEAYLDKMEYVFACIAKNRGVCLLWRPHPLLESTLHSLRNEQKERYLRLKQKYMEEGIGIYDDTPDIEKSICFSDAYIGDTSTSVVSLFGVSGKPIFLLDRRITTPPTEDDVRKTYIRLTKGNEQGQWLVTENNQLYYSPYNNYQYRYFASLSPEKKGAYYQCAIQRGNALYICPQNAQDIKVINLNHIGKKMRTIPLKPICEDAGFFRSIVSIGKYLFLIPLIYPSIVRFDTETEEVIYIDRFQGFNVVKMENGWKAGGSCGWENFLFLASPVENRVLQIDADTLKVKYYEISTDAANGFFHMENMGEFLYLLPAEGKAVCRLDPGHEEITIYEKMPQSLRSNYSDKQECLYGTPYVREEYTILPPWKGNMFIKIDHATGECTEWIPPRKLLYEDNNLYRTIGATGFFVKDNLYCQVGLREIYSVDTETGETHNLNVQINADDVRDHESGFTKQSEELPYACMETVVNSLPGFLAGKIYGAQHDPELQKKYISEINASPDGKCGQRVHEFIMKKLEGKG